MKRFRKVRKWLVLALLVSASSARAQLPAGPIAPAPGALPVTEPAKKKAQIKVQVALVNTPVTVRDARGQMVHDLDEKDFRVLDNGVPQRITHFDLRGDPLSIVILVENSSRVAVILPEVRKTGILLTQTVVGPGGEAALVTFNDSIDKLLDFTADADEIEKTLTHVKTGLSGSRLFDAMAVGVEMLTSRPQTASVDPATAAGPNKTGAGRRRVLLILSEAADAGSEQKLGAVLRQAQLANVTIYSVGLSSTRAELFGEQKSRTKPIAPEGTITGPTPPGTVQTPTTQEKSQGGADLLAAVLWAVTHIHDAVKNNVLEVATAGTGGMHLATYKDHTIEKAIDEIGGELHSQYSLSYSPSESTDYGYHEIKVELTRPGLKVRARPGYYLAAPEN